MSAKRWQIRRRRACLFGISLVLVVVPSTSSAAAETGAADLPPRWTSE
jgi:hypothetical protein